MRKRWVRRTGGIVRAAGWRDASGTSAARTLGVLAAVILAGACQRAPAPQDGDWLDYFEVVDSVTMTDSVIRPLLMNRFRFPEQPWRVQGVGSESWLLTPADGEGAAREAMGSPPDHDVPYWPSWTRTYGARTGATVFAAGTFTYVVRIYGAGAASGDSISAPPPSWVQGERPSMGQFPGPQEETANAYLRGLTVVTGLASVADSVLIVAHGRYRRMPFGRPADEIDHLLVGDAPSSNPHVRVSDHLNLYVNGERVVTDAPATGEILGYGEGRVVFGRRLPEGAGTRVTEYVWRRG